MKISNKIAAVALMLGFAVQANAQETDEATATASATIIAPIQIVKDVDMNFGDIIATSTGGTVTLAAAVEGGRTEDGVQLSTVGTAGTAAQFTVTGTGEYTYDITLPTGTHEIVNAANIAPEDKMAITGWAHSAGVSPVLNAGSDVFYVGATLNVVANQNPGAYTSASAFAVTVNYN
jgi:hypothetical protein